MPHSSFVERLRSRPLHQRYLIMVVGSIGLFVLIFWIWLFQLEHQLASLSGQTQFANENAAPIETKRAQGSPSQLSALFDALKHGGASLFSLFQKSSDGDTSKPNDPQQPAKEGDELDQFLKYQPFPRQ